MTTEKARWIEHAQQGRISQAYESYIDQPNQDKVILKALISLMGVQKHLRAKLWQQASDELIDCHNWPNFLDWQVLRENIEILKEANNFLDHYQAKEALETLEKVNLDACKAEVETQRGIAYIFLNEQSKAEHAFKEALKLDPKHYRALTNQGNLSLEKGDIASAIDAYEKALAINGDFSNALHNLGIAYRRQGKLHKSVRVLRKAQVASQRELKNASKIKKHQRSLWRYFFFAVLVVVLFLWLR